MDDCLGSDPLRAQRRPSDRIYDGWRREAYLPAIGGFVGHLVPTLPLAARFWDRMAGFSRLIVFDKRGIGLSDRDVGEYTLENIAEDALAVLDAVGAERVAVFGISEGVWRRRCSPLRTWIGLARWSSSARTRGWRALRDHPTGNPGRDTAGLQESAGARIGGIRAASRCGLRHRPTTPRCVIGGRGCSAPGLVRAARERLARCTSASTLGRCLKRFGHRRRRCTAAATMRFGRPGLERSRRDSGALGS